ncbi:DEAD/DEAH box helicase [uncultured Amphritea sp.]|uniref:DEAD/DEAH box helicase n=1 Tax=uncultured Amphritea sp. TaxID=981605 RepID=UPI0026054BB8|nr:DEAD/DEAH box helicase [uncultured Amphritea sp.]
MSNAENFTDLGLDPRLSTILDHQGISRPTEIQALAVPTAIVGHDLIASSKTGSGKTLAYLLPTMQRLMRQKALSKKDPRVLILTPTRELAKQVYAQLRSLVSGTQLRAVLVLGGENFNDQAKALGKDPHVVVATPGRLVNHLDERSLFLDGLELLILDEADRMLDLGFAEQLNRINQIASHRLRQTLMFSATLEHAEVNSMAKTLLKSPKRIAIGAANAEHADIEKRFYFADHLDHKQALLERILDTETYQQVIIFTATRADTERLSQLLSGKGLKTAALSGEMSQTDRNKIMDSFSRGQQQVLITTDVASRGLDLLQVSLVVNFDMPKQAEEYVHRIGRTGRAGAKGVAISLVGPKDWDAFKRVESFLQQSVNFGELDGLKAKFKGVKDAPVAKVPKSEVSAAVARPKRVIKAPQDRKNRRTANLQIVSDDGMAPLKKKKAD